jgi:hypothetical protein
MEYFKFDQWLNAFVQTGIDPYFYTTRERDEDEIFPWNHINALVTDEFLLREYRRSLNAEATPHCRSQCSACGLQNKDSGGICP